MKCTSAHRWRSAPRLRSAVTLGWILVTAALSSGCASVDFDYPKTESWALEETGDTNLASLVVPLAKEHPGESGFRLSYDGVDALAVRLVMAKYAEKSIDAQYYLITNDLVGYVFIESLLRAADRGVRVRLLLDDIQTKGYDAGMAALDSHPNFEVRIFNPFANRSARFLDAGDFGRVNRRMHNKSFTADNQVTIIGGRNIANEYFGAREDVNFGDIDVIGLGQVVQDVSEMFDMYWNHRAALPVPAFAEMPDDPEAALVALRERIAEAIAEARTSPYAAALEVDIQKYVESAGEIYTWAPYELVHDSPDKVQKELAAEAASITTPLIAAIQRAEEELVVLSPYFVPLDSGIEFFRELRERGVEVKVVTNSLATTNHSLVHSGYAPARKPLLEMGVRLFEIRLDAYALAKNLEGSETHQATLHTKSFNVDRRELFVGSFNWDPRSIDINTELGVIIHSTEIADQAATRLAALLPKVAYEVVLDDAGKLQWIDQSGDEPVILTSEPQTSWWRRFSAGFMRILPIKGQL
jgi:putative cardiolipin synthase